MDFIFKEKQVNMQKPQSRSLEHSSANEVEQTMQSGIGKENKFQMKTCRKQTLHSLNSFLELHPRLARDMHAIAKTKHL